MNFEKILEEEVENIPWMEQPYCAPHDDEYEGSLDAIYNAMKRVYNQALEDAVNNVEIAYDEGGCLESIEEESILKLKK